MDYDGFACMGERGTKYADFGIFKESNVSVVSYVRKVNLIYGGYEYICVYGTVLLFLTMVLMANDGYIRTNVLSLCPPSLVVFN